MASTFTLKRKTYTEFDYNNDVSTTGFMDGFFAAYEKLFGVPTASFRSKIAADLNKGSKPFEWGFGTNGVGKDDVARAARGKTTDYYGRPYHKDFMSHVQGEYSRFTGQPVRGNGNMPASQLQQRAASFIGKGYLY